MNAEKAALKRARENANEVESAAEPRFIEVDFENEVGGDSQLNNNIGTYKYEERPDMEVENLNAWERANLGEGDSDSDEDDQRRQASLM